MNDAGDQKYTKFFKVREGDFEKAGEVAAAVKDLLKHVQLDPVFIRRVTIALFEAEMNVVIHAKSGEIEFELAPECINIVVRDLGPGIPDIDLAMTEGYSTASAEAKRRGFGAGMGLANIHRNVDSMDIESVVGEGTVLRMLFNVPNL